MIQWNVCMRHMDKTFDMDVSLLGHVIYFAADLHCLKDGPTEE